MLHRGARAVLESIDVGDRYTLDRELGQGGMAVVYLARDRKHDRPVAIKILRPEIAADQAAQRFLLEIQILARLRHPHILALLDSRRHRRAAAPAVLFHAVRGRRDMTALPRRGPVRVRWARGGSGTLSGRHRARHSCAGLLLEER